MDPTVLLGDVSLIEDNLYWEIYLIASCSFNPNYIKQKQ
jgi:hypothetical protein